VTSDLCCSDGAKPIPLELARFTEGESCRWNSKYFSCSDRV